MAYEPDLGRRKLRDKLYPSEMAAKRVIGATRVHCIDEPEESDPMNAQRGEAEDDRVSEFNRTLRAGHGTGENEGE